MTCYFDLENFVAFSKQTIDKDYRKNAIQALSLLKDNFNIKINSKSYDECDEYVQILLTEFTDGVEGEVDLEFGCTANVLRQSNSFKGSILFLQDKETVSTIKERNEILCGGISEETDILSMLFLHKNKCHSEEFLGKNITAKNYLNLKNLPFTKLVIVDRYLLKNKDGISNIDFFEANILKLLKDLLASKKTRVDIIFVYQLKKTYDPVTKTHLTDGPEISKLTETIKKLVDKRSPKPNVIFIAVPTGKQIKDEHDRHIFSDYLRIKSGGSFIYFNNEGEMISSSTTVDFYSLSDRQYAENSINILKKIEEYSNYTLKNYGSDCYMPSTYNSDEMFKF
ncbi:hypothetical protein [Kaistella carnis]|uniref:hypothetical protein n=1 Tax=Kaistella carnis TaxID=1241979 RepID=UPI00289A6017|nr:hypothetical protein [Kaistella carnis]